MDDSFKLDLAGYDRAYIEEVLDGFLENAPSHGRKVLEVRMSQAMFDKLNLAADASGSFFKGVPVVIVATPFDSTVEVVVGKPQ
jgi:hypothetical protein